tara:strand:+ start:123 stop:401 length:279 start_codon:yes stop_codon:yes gene_type:complete
MDNYIKILDRSGLALYIIQVEAGSRDDILLTDMLFDNKVNFIVSSTEEFKHQLSLGGNQYSITGQDILNEHTKRTDANNRINGSEDGEEEIE